MNGHSGDQVDALRSLDPHDAKTVAKQLCYRIPESKDSLYFILRGLGLPVTGELGSTPRVEVDAKEYPTLWRALDCLRVPHDGKLMVIKAESPSLDALCGKPAEKRGVQRPTSAVKGGPPAPPAPEPREEIEPIRSVPSSRPQSAQRCSSGYPSTSLPKLLALPGQADPNSFLHEHAWQQAPVPQAPMYPVGPTRLFRNASEPRLSPARAKELLNRLTRPATSREVKEIPIKRPASAPMSVEEQRRRCENLAQPKAQPKRYRQRCRFRRRCSATVVAAQRASMERLARPKSAKVDAEDWEEPDQEDWPSQIQRPETRASGCFSGVPESRPGAWMLQVMKQNAAQRRGDQETARYVR